MIKVNILPIELRRQKGLNMPIWVSLNFFTFPIIALILMVVVDLLLALVLFWLNVQKNIIDTRSTTFKPLWEQAKALESDLKYVQDLKKGAREVGLLLNEISDCMPINGWLYGFSMDITGKALTLKGSFYRPSKVVKGVGDLNTFLACLREGPSFSRQVDVFNVRQIFQRNIKDTPVSDFTLECTLKEK